MEMSSGIIGIVLGIAGIVVTIAVAFCTRKGKSGSNSGNQVQVRGDGNVIVNSNVSNATPAPEVKSGPTFGKQSAKGDKINQIQVAGDLNIGSSNRDG